MAGRRDTFNWLHPPETGISRQPIAALKRAHVRLTKRFDGIMCVVYRTRSAHAGKPCDDFRPTFGRPTRPQDDDRVWAICTSVRSRGPFNCPVERARLCSIDLTRVVFVRRNPLPIVCLREMNTRPYDHSGAFVWASAVDDTGTVIASCFLARRFSGHSARAKSSEGRFISNRPGG